MRLCGSLMATATIYTFEIQLADVDRGVYESLSLRVARQPSETEEYLLTRVLAYCLEYARGDRLLARARRAGRAGARGARPDRRAADLDRDRRARRGAAAQGQQGGAAGGRLHPQGSRPAAAPARRASASTAPTRWRSTPSTARCWRSWSRASTPHGVRAGGHRPPPLRHPRRDRAQRRRHPVGSRLTGGDGWRALLGRRAVEQPAEK